MANEKRIVPFAHQVESAKFLVSKPYALLASEPRTGKTGSAIMAADAICARSILVVTTASGRGIWRRAFADWQTIARSVAVLGVDKHADCDVIICSWAGLRQARLIEKILSRKFDKIILDECHNAANPDTKTTQAVYGKRYEDGRVMMISGAVVDRSDRIAWLSGSPCPHDPGQLWSMLRAGCPELLKADGSRSWPDVTRYDDFKSRYCVIVMKAISNWTKIPVVIKGKNEAELHERIKSFFLRHTQKDVGINPPSFDMLPLIVSPAARKKCDGDVNRTAVIKAIEAGLTSELEMELSSLMLHTGIVKAHAVVEAAKEELDGGLDKLVLMRWNLEVGRILQEGLASYGVVTVDGSTSPKDRDEAQRRFREDPKRRVFDGQIQAAGEAVDLSAACELWFVQTCWTPALLGQAAQRISNLNQKRSTFVRVCTIEGSIDELIQARVASLWASIRQIVN
jgi:SNF2 family DNA or RNA helicase